jgi:hypothetical protein
MKRKKVFRLMIVLFICTFFLVHSLYAQNRITMSNGDRIFVSGMNVAWNNYSNDVGNTPLDTTWFRTMLDGIQEAGGNAMRWWLFTNAANAPTFNSSGYVNGPGSETINNISIVLDMALERNIVVSLCLFSFDLFQTGQQGVNEANNRRIMTTETLEFNGLSIMHSSQLFRQSATTGQFFAGKCSMSRKGCATMYPMRGGRMYLFRLRMFKR